MKIGFNGSFPLYENLKELQTNKTNCFAPISTLERELVTLVKKLAAIDDLQKEIEKSGVQWDVDNNYQDTLLDLIESVDKFYDIAYLLIRNTSDINDGEEITNAIDWAKKYENKKYGFLSAIKSDHEWIRKISNLKKHDDVRIGFFNMTTEAENTVYGFFFGTIENEAFTPNLEIHRPYNGMKTGFSYNRFINQLITHILRIIKELNKSLFNGANKNQGLPCNDMKKIINFLHINKPIYFPDEYSIKMTAIEKGKNSYTLKFIKGSYTERFTSMNLTMMVKNQGNKGSYIPYMGSA